MLYKLLPRNENCTIVRTHRRKEKREENNETRQNMKMFSYPFPIVHKLFDRWSPNL